MQNPRECALDVLIKVDKKEELSHIAISNVLEKYQFSEKRDRAFFTRLVEGTLERQITIDYVADQFSKTKIRKCKPLIRALLRMGIYQILYMDQVPDSAACNEAVYFVIFQGRKMRSNIHQERRILRHIYQLLILFQNGS